MHNLIKRYGKELIRGLALSFFFASLFLMLTFLFLGDKIEFGLTLINKISIVEKNIPQKETKIDPIKKRLKNYPSYKEKYAQIFIPSISLALPVYHGDTLEILKSGVGHYAGSYFPGEGASIVMAAHNNAGFFRKLPEIKIEDKIEIQATYGTFTYEVYNTKIINEKDEKSFPIQTDEEILMLYTCYPVTAIGHTDLRYVVYARKVSEKIEKEV